LIVRTLAAVLVLLHGGESSAGNSVTPGAQSEPAFTEWARARIVPLDSSLPFRAFDRGIADARLIGMGESFHETQPFGSFRLELLQDLVRRHRVTALILESGLPEGIALDDYVHGRTSSVDWPTALPGDLGTLVHIRQTIEWLREWNRAEGRRHPVSVYGADLPGRQGSMLPALDRLAQLTEGDPGMAVLIDAVRPAATQTSSTWWRGAAQKYDALSPEAKSGLTESVNRLAGEAQRMPVSDRDRLEWIRRVARVLQQNETTLRLGFFAPAAPRDEAMAENILWILDRLAKGERAVYWAHNAHVQRTVVKGSRLPPGAFPSAGSRLGVTLGQRYYAIGTAYGGPSREDRSAPAAGSVDATMARLSPRPFILVLRGGSRPAAAGSWLAEERPMRFQAGYLDLALGDAFDAVVSFDAATAAARAPR
jgi:erythromycin esterase-like protein